MHWRSSSPNASSSSNSTELWRWFWKLNISRRKGCKVNQFAIDVKWRWKTQGVTFRDCQWSAFFREESILGSCFQPWPNALYSRLDPTDDKYIQEPRVLRNLCSAASVYLEGPKLSASNGSSYLTTFVSTWKHQPSQITKQQMLGLVGTTLSGPNTSNGTLLTDEWIKWYSCASLYTFGRTRLAGIFRNKFGTPLGIAKKFLQNCCEAEACRLCFEEARKRGFKVVIFEIDNQLIINCLQSGLIPLKNIGTIVDDTLLCCQFFDHMPTIVDQPCS